jgi:hypothetical protein
VLSSGKVGKVALGVHPLMENAQDANIIAPAAKVDEVVSGFHPPDQRTELDGSSAVAIRKQTLRGVAEAVGVAIRLSPPPVALGVDPDFGKIDGRGRRERQAARDFARSRASAMIASKLNSLSGALSPSAISSLSLPRPCSESIRIRWRTKSLALEK